MGLLDQRSKLRLFKAIIASIILCIPIQLVEDSMYLRDEIPVESRKREKGTNICCWTSIVFASEWIFDMQQFSLLRFVVIDIVLAIDEDVH